MSSKKTPRKFVLTFLTFTAAAFVAVALGTDWVGPIGADIAEAMTSMVGAMAWIVPVEIAAVGIAQIQNRKPLAVVLPLLGDIAMTIALSSLFMAGDVGATLGGAVREYVATVGTAFGVLIVGGLLAIGRLSLVGRLVAPIVRIVAKHVAEYVKAERAERAAAKKLDESSKKVVKPEEAPKVEQPKVKPLPAPTTAGGFALPRLDFLKRLAGGKGGPAADDAQRLIATLASHGITAKVEQVHTGPTVTTFECSLASGTKLSKVTSLVDDVSLSLGRKVRIVSAHAGLVGFEIPNATRAPVALRDLLEDEAFQKSSAALPVVLGRDMQGNAVYADIAAMPHAIVAGASGSGKSVGLNVMLASLLCKKTPEELRFIMIDPKVVELAPYEKIPHMLMPVVTDMKEAAGALAWAVAEMERRYQLFAQTASKNIASYNAKASAADKMPFIVIVVDEFADLIMQQGKEVEASVVRLGQKARAAGMHMILATQRPSVDVITGTIKANFSSRIAYRVASGVDSRTILDETGAESLFGMGDALVKLNGASESRRVQAPMISEEEIATLTASLREVPRAAAPAPEATPKINVRATQQAQA